MNNMEYYKTRKEMSYKGWTYSVHRMDLLLIAIAGTGLYVTLETLKLSMEHYFEYLWMAKFSGILYVAAIVVNFIGQHFGKMANKYDMLWCDCELDYNESKLEKDKEDAAKYDKLSEAWSERALAANTISLALLSIGLALTVIFFYITF